MNHESTWLLLLLLVLPSLQMQMENGSCIEKCAIYAFAIKNGGGAVSVP